MVFTKSPFNTADHIELLIKRGLEISNKDRTAYYIDSIGYYRLTGYMYPFQQNTNNQEFKKNVSFEIILDHYKFDKKLRFLLLDAIERIEIFLRSGLSNSMALTYGAHWYLDSTHFLKEDLHSKMITSISSYCDEANELFIKSYQKKYTEPALPPAWMIMETLTFGGLSSLFENLRLTEEKRKLCLKIGTVEPILKSWLKSINFVRNCCAHHSRLWNRKLPLKPQMPSRKGKEILQQMNEDTNKRMYGILSCMVFILSNINPSCKFKTKLKKLFSEYPDVNIQWMGFPSNWEEEPLWK